MDVMTGDSEAASTRLDGSPRRRPARRLGDAVSRRLRALDHRLHIDHSGRSEWIWAVPVLGFLGTFALVIVQGAVISDTTPALYTPIALLIAGVIAGLSIAYMRPEADPADGSDDGGSEGRGPESPRPLDDWSRWMREPPDRLPEEPAPAEPASPRPAVLEPR
jgi:hypothetical protein